MTNLASGIKAGGIVVFWSLKDDNNREVIIEGLKKAGLVNCAPEARTQYASLKTALEKKFVDSNIEIKPLKDHAGCEVVQFTPGEVRGTFNSLLSVEITDTGLQFNGYTCSENDVQTEYAAQRRTISGAAVAGVLVKVLAKLSATSLRPTGGFYWLPDAARAQWEQVTEAVHKADRQNACWQLTVAYDADMLTAVSAALVREVVSSVNEIKSDVSDLDEIGMKALETRKAMALALKSKIKTYETLLETPLTALLAQADEAEVAAANAVMDLSIKQAELAQVTNSPAAN